MFLGICFNILIVACAVMLLFPSPASASYKFISVCFTPGDNCRLKVINEISSAKSYLRVQAYQLTDPEIINAIISDRNRGVDVGVILDKTQYSKTKDLSGDILARDGIPVWIDRKVSIAHNKVMLIDHREVITGSYNFSLSAQKRNAENLLIINVESIEKAYEDNFNKRLLVSDRV